MNGSASVLVNKPTPGFSATVKTLLKRLVRLLLCLEPAMINQHLVVLDACVRCCLPCCFAWLARVCARPLCANMRNHRSYVLFEIDLFSELLASDGLSFLRVARSPCADLSLVPRLARAFVHVGLCACRRCARSHGPA